MATRLKFALALSTALMAVSPALAQQAYFNNYYGFGDSLSDNGRVLRETGYNPREFVGNLINSPGIYEGGRASNGPSYYEVVPSLIGVRYNANNDYAVASAMSTVQPANQFISPAFPFGLPNQVDDFLSRVGRLGPRDLVNIWIGYNDITPAQTGTPEQKVQAVTNSINNTLTAVNRLVAVGGREFVIFNQKTDRPLGNDLANDYNTRLPQALAPLSAQGINIHYFDVNALINRLRANPTAFGYGPDANLPCNTNRACAMAGYTTIVNGSQLEDLYISPEGVHNTGRTNRYIGAFLANQLNAPLTIGPQGELGQSAGMAFSSTLIDFLSAERRRNMAMSVPATYTADLPGRTAPPVTIPVQVGSPLSIFALGTYLNVDRTAQNGAGRSTGNTFSADFGGVTAGLMYQATPNLVLGAAFNYLNTSVDLRGLSNGRIDMDSFQGAGFASLSFPNFFADVVGTYGRNNYTLDRPGVLNDRLTASPSGDTFTVAARTGYLFDFGTFKAGPVGEVAYANVSVDAYRERGDVLLTIGTRRQDLEGLTAGGGVQIRTTLPIFGGLANPFLNVTAQHDFLDGVRTVTSFQTYAPSLLIRTQTGRRGDDVYGRVAGGLDLDFGNGLSGVLTGSTSFGRSGGDDHTVSAGLRYRF